MIYRIANWNTKYENNRSREVKDAQWFPCPNVFDGDGYCYMVAGKDGPLAYCGWILLCGVASRCNPRGVLIQTTGHPHTPETIAAKTRVPVRVIELAIDRALHTKWLEPHEGAIPSQEGAGSSQEGATGVRKIAIPSARTERNGTEENGARSLVLSPVRENDDPAFSIALRHIEAEAARRKGIAR